MSISSPVRPHNAERESDSKTIAQQSGRALISIEGTIGETQTAVPRGASLDPSNEQRKPESERLQTVLAGVANLKSRMNHFESKSEELTTAISQAGELETRMDRYAAKTTDLASTVKRLDGTFDNFVEVDELADLLKARDVRIRGLEADVKRHKTRSQMLEARTQNLEQRLAALEVAAAPKPSKQKVNSEFGAGYEAW